MKKLLTKITVIAIAVATFLSANAQIAYLDKPDEFDPAKPTKIMVNLKLTKNEWGIVEIAQTEDMYLWIWKPKELAVGDPNANGTGSAPWKSSNDVLKMTKEADGLYSYTITATTFFGVDAATVYKEDFHFLVKPKDGGGYGNPDKKTEDLTIEVDAPVGPVVKLQSVPTGKGAKKDTMISETMDVFTILYNNAAETKGSMQNATELYVFAVAYDANGNAYKIANTAKKVADFPQLKMKNNGAGVFQFSIIPERLFTLPSGSKITRIEFEIVKPNLVNSNDAIDEKLVYHFNVGGC